MNTPSTRCINPVNNEAAILRIKTTFDSLVVSANNSAGQPADTPVLVYAVIDLPEAMEKLPSGKDGDFFYGYSEDGVEGLLIRCPLGGVVVYRNGEFIYPDGMTIPEKSSVEDDYDFFYRQLHALVRDRDMPDKIEDPLEDEIDIDDGFEADDESDLI